MSTNRTIIPLLIAAPILLIVGVVITLAAWLFDGLSQYNEAWATTLQYGVGFVIAAGAAVALVLVSRRGERTRLTRAGTVAGAILTTLAVLASGLPFVISLAGLIYTGVRSLQAPTTEETTSMTELQAQTQQLFDGLELADGDSQVSRYGCLLGNLHDGEQHVAFEIFHLPSRDKDSAYDAIETRWESLGYEVGRSDDSLFINDQRLIESARVGWHSDAGSDEGTLAIDVTTICVVER